MKRTGKYSSFGRQFNYCSWWDGNLTLHLHAGETILTVIAIPHVSGPSKNAWWSKFIICYNSACPSFIVAFTWSMPCANKEGRIRHQCLMRTGTRTSWCENDIFIRGFVRLGFSVWGQERLQRHMPSIRAPLMRIICSQRVRGQGWGHLIPQGDRESFEALMVSHAQGRGQPHSPTNNPTCCEQITEQSKWVRAGSLFPTNDFISESWWEWVER